LKNGIAPIRFDNYDYETDDPRQARYLQTGDQRIPFTDIAQLRERQGQLWYDYWDLTGAKMWITNGRMAGLFCLYAKTPEGVTGFVVDRHAEGLIVGKDEAKLGQCGSPTNELSLQSVRVPRENVLGLEGRGQVNALETLNVGRAGLGVSSTAQMRGLIESSRQVAKQRDGSILPWVAWRLQRMEEICYVSEALAFEVVGRFDHRDTKSVRMESAIAKLLATELLHQVIALAEDIHGAVGQTQEHLVEKRRRDARVLTIYEGTNEVQHFSILKDLVVEVVPHWNGTPAAPRHQGTEALAVQALKVEVRTLVSEGVANFGAGLWQDPSLQPEGFLLAEAVAWLKAADSTLGRLAWVARREATDDDTPPSPAVYLGRAALRFCTAQVRECLRRGRDGLSRLRRGQYAPAIHATSLLFHHATPAHVWSTSKATRLLSILVIVEPQAVSGPRPHLERGRLLATHWSLPAADRAALATAIRWREQATAKVSITVAAVGPLALASSLQEILAYDVERAVLVRADSPVSSASAARVLADVLAGQSFDVVLGGATSEGTPGLLFQLIAAHLGVTNGGFAADVAVQTHEAGGQVTLTPPGQEARSCHLPCAVAITSGLDLWPLTTRQIIGALTRKCQVVEWPSTIIAQPVEIVESASAKVAMQDNLNRVVRPAEAASLVMRLLGVQANQVAVAPYNGPIVDTQVVDLPSVCGIVASESSGRLHADAAAVVRAVQALGSSAVVICVTDSEEAQRCAVAAARALGASQIFLCVVESGVSTNDTNYLTSVWRQISTKPRLAIGESWTEPAWSTLGMAERSTDLLSPRVRRLTVSDSCLTLEQDYSGDKLRARLVADAASARGYIALQAGADVQVNGTTVATALSVLRWRPTLPMDLMAELVGHVKRTLGIERLADAEFIIDVGFGVGSRDGYENVVDPLEQALRQLGVPGMAVGGSRKVTEELHLLPADRQIGQSGVSVRPRILLALGISGAPQHIQYIGTQALIVAFNRDAGAPLMTLNQRQPEPRVVPVVGDLFVTVPQFIAALCREQGDVAPPATLVGRAT
jgi:electron transfer flavoprotein alpha subunit